MSDDSYSSSKLKSFKTSEETERDELDFQFYDFGKRNLAGKPIQRATMDRDGKVWLCFHLRFSTYDFALSKFKIVCDFKCVKDDIE